MRYRTSLVFAAFFLLAFLASAPSQSAPRDYSTVFYVRLAYEPTSDSVRIAEHLAAVAGEGNTFHAVPEHPEFDRDSVAARAGVAPDLIPDLGLIYRLRADRPLHSDSTVIALAALPFIEWAEPATGLELRSISETCRQRVRPVSAEYAQRSSFSSAHPPTTNGVISESLTPSRTASYPGDVAAGLSFALENGSQRTHTAGPAEIEQNLAEVPEVDTSSLVTIGIFDQWHTGATGPTQLPPELMAIDPFLARLQLTANSDCSAVYGVSYGGHGLQVASVAASELSRYSVERRGEFPKVRLRGYWSFLQSIPEMVDDGVHVLSISALYRDRPRLREYVKYALAQGVVVVAAAGNTIALQDGLNYPAAYYYEDLDLQVIAVSATDADDNAVAGFVTSPGADPRIDPERAFIDVAAPGVKVRVVEARRNREDGAFAFTSRPATGTSLSVPAVSTLAAILLEQEPRLTVRDIFDLITANADRVGAVEYHNGWSRELGYGRINSARTIEALTSEK